MKDKNFLKYSIFILKKIPIADPKKVPKKPNGKIIPTKRIFVFKFRDLIFFKLEPKNRVGLQNIRN